MGTSTEDPWVAMDAEFKRLGLDARDIPGLAMKQSEVEQFLARLRGVQPGATWHDVLPDLPPEFVPGQFDTWPNRYAPFGPYDYQELPAGPAVHIYFDGATDASLLYEFMSSARDAGWPVYGAGRIPMENSEILSLHAIVVLERGTNDDTYMDFVNWIEEDGPATVAVLIRPPNEKYTSS